MGEPFEERSSVMISNSFYLRSVSYFLLKCIMESLYRSSRASCLFPKLNVGCRQVSKNRKDLQLSEKLIFGL